MLYGVGAVGVIISLALAGCVDNKDKSGKGKDGATNTTNPDKNNPNKTSPSNDAPTGQPPPPTKPQPAAPPYSITGGQAWPSWNASANPSKYDGVKVTGTLVASNQGTFDASKIELTANCGGKTGTNSNVPSAAFSDVLIEMSGLTPSDLVSCTVAATYYGTSMETGTIAWDKVVELGKKFTAGDVTGTSCTNISGLYIAIEGINRWWTLRYSASDYSNATYLVNTAAYNGGCIIGGKYVVGNARKEWSDGSGVRCWPDTNASTGNISNTCLSATTYKSTGVYFLDSSGKLWRDSRT